MFCNIFFFGVIRFFYISQEAIKKMIADISFINSLFDEYSCLLTQKQRLAHLLLSNRGSGKLVVIFVITMIFSNTGGEID